VDVTKHEQVADLGALEGEDWHARPPNMPTARRHTEQVRLARSRPLLADSRRWVASVRAG